MRKALSIGSHGVLTWLVPFLVGMFLYTPDGQPVMDLLLTKSLLLLVFAAVSAGLLVRWFRRVDSGFAREGLVVGGAWLAVNWALDLAVLVPMSGMSVTDWLGQIGLRYLLLPLMAVAMGTALDGRRAPVAG